MLAKPQIRSGCCRPSCPSANQPMWPAYPPPPVLLSLEPLQEPYWLTVLRSSGWRSDASAAKHLCARPWSVLFKPLTPAFREGDLFPSVPNWNAEHIFSETQHHTCYLVSVSSMSATLVIKQAVVSQPKNIIIMQNLVFVEKMFSVFPTITYK